MKNNEKLIKIAIKSFLIISLIVTLFVGFIYFASDILDSLDAIEIMYFYVGCVLFFYIPIVSFLCFGKISFDFGKKIVEIENGQFDIDKEKNYYRDILNEHSTLELAYIDKMGDLEDDDVIAELLTLEKKKVIELKNNRIVRIDKSQHIANSEKYLLKKTTSGKALLNDRLTSKVQSELLQKGLIKYGDNKLKDILLMIAKTAGVSLISVAIIVLISYLVYNDIGEFLILLLGFITLILILVIIFSFVYLFSYLKHKLDYELTEKGKELKFKLNGLKRYIKDFSNLDEKDKKFLTLWDEYLIYSVMFGENEKVKEELKDFVIIEKAEPFLNKEQKIMLIFYIIIAIFMFIVS